MASGIASALGGGGNYGGLTGKVALTYTFGKSGNTF